MSLEFDLPGIRKTGSGKVREIFDAGDHAIIVSTDRISAFDCILQEPIPGKGIVLNQLSAYWFQKFSNIANHFVSTAVDEFPKEFQRYSAELSGRSMLVRKARPLPVECVVRGYLAGSAWKEYQTSGAVNGQPLPAGLKLASRLPEVLFTPSTKAHTGHDQAISWSQFAESVGPRLAPQIRDISLSLFTEGSDFAYTRGIIVADTKFEFGTIDDRLVLIDECLTPDSSRFWPVAGHEEGTNPPSFDKQFVRDYLESVDWNKQPPAPHLPAEVIEKTVQKYQDALVRLTGYRLA
ncbi:MAG TPA: phosphoribosylaminoimidazolesuccinocarboxamide synthase [Chthoniobacterales bacterium]|jgi:phosphoribosylaminoimidazole-succinocarboxamide synthase|nr:phosphoribosylaminoimidazolesuccinocarboxamide synthase [Chthoniobacterales bacterium]